MSVKFAEGVNPELWLVITHGQRFHQQFKMTAPVGKKFMGIVRKHKAKISKLFALNFVKY